MRDYAVVSLEIHLFFARIMKEHSFFLEAGFVSKDSGYIKKADQIRCQFEELLEETVKLSVGVVGCEVLNSQEIVTNFTLQAENRTSQLTGIAINSNITEKECSLSAGKGCRQNRELYKTVQRLNRRALALVGQLIDFKEAVLREVLSCRMYTANYPLLIEHIIREARLYQSFLRELETRGTISARCMRDTEKFWNQIMMEHALFIRGLLDPCEEELITAADGFANDYKKLLAQAKEQECRVTDSLTAATLQKTKEYCDFKTAGTKGITECGIRSIILPLLADHVLREANHYLRILQCSEEGAVRNQRNLDR